MTSRTCGPVVPSFRRKVGVAWTSNSSQHATSRRIMKLQVPHKKKVHGPRGRGWSAIIRTHPVIPRLSLKNLSVEGAGGCVVGRGRRGVGKCMFDPRTACNRSIIIHSVIVDCKYCVLRTAYKHSSSDWREAVSNKASAASRKGERNPKTK